jgi:hypothetical protein
VQKSEKGVIFIVSGSDYYLKEAIHSAKSLKKYSPTISITLFSNIVLKELERQYFDFQYDLDSNIHPLKAKVKYLEKSPYEITLFLDSDTEIRKPIDELFEFMNHYDLGLAKDNLVDWTQSPPKFIDYIDPDFFNTGLLLFKKTEPVKLFFAKWIEILDQQDESIMKPGYFCDQHYFNVLTKDLSFHKNVSMELLVLPNKIYNVRPWAIEELIKTREYKNIKIIHMHGLNNQKYSSRLKFFLFKIAERIKLIH